jgi:hypothetical protein
MSSERRRPRFFFRSSTGDRGPRETMGEPSQVSSRRGTSSVFRDLSGRLGWKRAEGELACRPLIIDAHEISCLCTCSQRCPYVLVWGARTLAPAYVDGWWASRFATLLVRPPPRSSRDMGRSSGKPRGAGTARAGLMRVGRSQNRHGQQSRNVQVQAQAQTQYTAPQRRAQWTCGAFAQPPRRGPSFGSASFP